MTHETSSRSGRLSAYAAFERLTGAAAQRGLTLVSNAWNGVRSHYSFRCERGHQFSRQGSVVLRSTITCLQCIHEDTQQRFLDILSARGFICEENAYLGQTVRQHFVCHAGHRWETEARKILEGSGCPTCAARARAELYTFADGLERLCAAAAARGGRCLANTYAGMAASYPWECALGHRWNAPGHRVVAGRWCGACAARRIGETRRRNGMARLKAAAQAHGGECLDKDYAGSNAKYHFRCAQGHEWHAWGHLVLGGTWCKACANLRKRRTIEQMHELAQERGGRCLSKAYIGNKVKLNWECSLGHVWEALPGNIISRGTWCPNCFRLRITRNPALRGRYDISE